MDRFAAFIYMDHREIDNVSQARQLETNSRFAALTTDYYKEAIIIKPTAVRSPAAVSA